MTPTRRLTMANTISAVTAIFGIAARNRNMRRQSLSERGTRLERVERVEATPSAPGVALTLKGRDFVPQCAELTLVGRPNFLLRDFAEQIDFCLNHGHALRLEQLLGALEVVD